MKMRVHELHPAVIHAPLALLPAAAIADLGTALRGGRGGPGRALWWAGAGSGLLAGLAGLAASQEVTSERRAVDGMMWLHGIGNLAIVSGALGIAAWRQGHRATVGQALLGLGACTLALYTAYLGGELVYAHGVGVRATERAERERRGTPLLSWAAPWVLLRDAGRGLRWLFGKVGRVATGRDRLARDAFGFVGEPPVVGAQPFPAL